MFTDLKALVTSAKSRKVQDTLPEDEPQQCITVRRSESPPLHYRLCKEGSFRKASKGTVLRSLGNDPIFFIVTRNPLQRFVSAFMQLCMNEYCSSFPFLKFVRVIRHDILQREEMAKTYDSLFKIAGVPMQQRSYIRSELTGGLPPHATWNKADRIDIQNELLSNNTLLEIFLQLYYHDFVIFGYDFPTPRYTQ
ncbi:hypothetical protein RB195_019738 [Necator americanus]|uniref:Carbohydrate sulfotransferase n=1 Tax=Necator americanus TaxID=51031 RepID=A0ABR1CFK4_NECAM